MCFASSVVESHKKLFIANAGGGSDRAHHSGSSLTEGVKGPRSDKQRSSNIASSGGGGSNSSNTSLKNTKMSRSKTRIPTEVCGDCGASDPSWASINRGILLCSDCCSVHRSLGRHISIVKSLRQGSWEPSVLNFVNSLNAHGANCVWEHHLLDSTTSGNKGPHRLRKPSPKDPLHPNKSDFIKAKHVQLAFVLKPNLQDADDDITGSAGLEHELSKQLHASVRTSNLETSLRLLVQGADPNFFHEEKRSTPLHVAAKFGQASQIELLIVHGAEINVVDGNGLTPLEVAKANNHTLIADRLLDAMYEVSDRIIMYLGGKKPDHTTGRHLVIPEMHTNEISEQLKIARGRLQLVPNKMFEELVMDLYDEVDRRENEAIWSTSTLNAENVAAVPFLPANPFLSATRNQGRQKLARFSRAEFNGLLTDVLIDARRRQNMANLRPLDGPQQQLPPNTSSSSNAVNSSASSSSMPNNNLSSFYGGFNSHSTNNNLSNSTGIGNDYHDPNLSDDEPIYDPVADDDYEPMPPMAQQAVVHQSAKPPEEMKNFEMLHLRKQINEYVTEINQLRNVVHKLSTENSELKSKFSNVDQQQQQAQQHQQQSSTASNNSVYDEPLRIDLRTDDNDHEPHSLPEGLNSSLAQSASFSATTQTANAGSSSTSTSTSSSTTNSQQSTIKRPASMYERRLQTNVTKTNADSRNTTSMYQMAGAENSIKSFNEEVNQKADIVTHRLKELIHTMQDSNNKETLIPCAERIRAAVLELINVFTTPANCNETIRETLMQLTRNNILIQHSCENLRNSLQKDDKTAITKYFKDVRECAYYIASATKTLVLQLD
ncbi:ARF GTPase-activating protein Git [Stomoxys calcitrans]|uniref:Arf-GAP domain-containing protein n=1 Tax=Stomoxys calcitrans TaxID=35570 RepID=A0A1I8Q748_STOCA|nr:ARF GTPase-activating protein Git [Stomoxys calcitrans]